MQMLLFRPHLTLAVVSGLMLPFAVAQTGPNSTPVRYQAQYTQIYFDDIETAAPTLTPGFVLNTGGSLTTNPAEVISGKRSIKGVGTGSYSNFLNTNSQIIPFASKGNYRVTFHYRVVVTLDQGFQAAFASPEAIRDNYPSPVTVINGAAAQAGQTGTGTINGTLGPYSDYQLFWGVFANGAVVVDDIQITDTTTGKLVAAEDAEGSNATVGPGLQLQNGASVVTDPVLVIGGKASVRLANWGSLTTRPEAWALVGNTTYLVEFDYRILNPGTGDYILRFNLQPTGTTDPLLGQPFGAPMLKNAAASGTFSAGSMTGRSASYVLTIVASSATTSVIVDNIRILKQSVTGTTTVPDSWSKLASLPFPRLGNYQLLASTSSVAQTATDEGVPFTYSADQLDGRLAFSDVIIALGVNTQVNEPASIWRLRNLNPNAVILPYRNSQQEAIRPAPSGSNPDVEGDFHQGLANEWYVKDTKGNDVAESEPTLHMMNVSDFCPIINGQTFTSYLSNWLTTTVFPSGIWDGIFLDDLLDRTNQELANHNDPALLDYDWNRNGLRDETPASSNEMTRSSAMRFIAGLRSKIGGSQLVIATTFHIPALVFAPYVNGHVFEIFNKNYNGYFSNTGGESPGRWFAIYDAYRRTQANTLPPKLNVLEASGWVSGKSTGYLAPTAQDFLEHRLGLGTALLDDGFYEYDLKENISAPYWFDEYSVDQNGVAVEDRSKKGYLGQALGDAVELGGAGSLLIQEGFEGETMPATFTTGTGGVSVSQAPGDVITGNASLVISNPDHTKRAAFSVDWNPTDIVAGSPGTYMLVFDWRVLETLDGELDVNAGSDRTHFDISMIPGVVAGDSGTVRLPLSLSPGTRPWANFALNFGGGKVAIDNIRLYQGGAGPLRRDFENGFVLVNPFNSPHTFSAAELAGSLSRTGIHRIKGTQAPDVNNGQPVTGDLTLAPFDGIILLADHIDAHATAPSTAKPYITPNGIISAGAFGGFSTAAPGSWIEIYGSNLSTTTRGWAGTDFNGSNAPTSLDGVKVAIGGHAAFIAYISPGQVNALVPSDVPAGPVQVVISGPTGTSDPYIAVIESVRPGLLAPSAFQINGKQYVAAFFADNVTFAMPSGAIPGVPSRPAKPGETVVLWGIGFGPVTPNVQAGVLVGQANSLSAPLQVSFGNTPAKLAYSGLAPQATGLYQFNVVVPDVPDNSAVPLTISLAGVPGTQTLYIAVQH